MRAPRAHCWELENDVILRGRAAPNWDRALRLVQPLRPGLLLTDIEMPGMTGLENRVEISVVEISVDIVGEA